MIVFRVVRKINVYLLASGVFFDKRMTEDSTVRSLNLKLDVFDR